MSTENVLQGILSQKIVQDGGGYAARTDIVNVDNITATGAITTSGSININNGKIENVGQIRLNTTSTQAGRINFTSTGDTTINTTVPGVTTSSVVILTPNTSLTGTYILNTTEDQKIKITLSESQNITFHYFVAKY